MLGGGARLNVSAWNAGRLSVSRGQLDTTLGRLGQAVSVDRGEYLGAPDSDHPRRHMSQARAWVVPPAPAAALVLALALGPTLTPALTLVFVCTASWVVLMVRPEFTPEPGAPTYPACPGELLPGTRLDVIGAQNRRVLGTGQ